MILPGVVKESVEEITDTGGCFEKTERFSEKISEGACPPHEAGGVHRTEGDDG